MFIAMASLALLGASCVPVDPVSAPVGSTSRVFTSAGSKQCEPARDDLQRMSSGLRAAGVRVVRSACGVDGMMYPAVCGGGDGRIGIFDIPSSDLAKAQAAGYSSLSARPDASEIACRS